MSRCENEVSMSAEPLVGLIVAVAPAACPIAASVKLEKF
jgi:hypothetical protein